MKTSFNEVLSEFLCNKVLIIVTAMLLVPTLLEHSDVNATQTTVVMQECAKQTDSCIKNAALTNVIGYFTCDCDDSYIDNGVADLGMLLVLQE